MKRAAMGLLLLGAACASSNTAGTPKTEVQFTQVHGPSDLGVVRGGNTMQIDYAVGVTNRSTQPITLRRITVMSVGTGSYQLRSEEKVYNVTIGPDAQQVVPLSALGYFDATPSGEASREPVTLRATLYFDAPTGSFRRIITQNIGQFPGAQ